MCPHQIYTELNTPKMKTSRSSSLAPSGFLPVYDDERSSGTNYDNKQKRPQQEQPANHQNIRTKRLRLTAWIIVAILVTALVALVTTYFVSDGSNNVPSDSLAEISNHSGDAYMPRDASIDMLSDYYDEGVLTTGPSNAPTTLDIAAASKESKKDEEVSLDATTNSHKTLPSRDSKEFEEASLDAPTNKGNLTIGVYYYPWYGNNFHNGRYLRGELQPIPQLPALGEYDDTKPEVIKQHLEWSQGANINLWVASWWGPDSREDNTLTNVILPHSDLPGTKVALFYETTGRIKQSNNYDTANVYPDIAYMAKHYFDDPNYHRIDGRPVLFVYLTRVLSGVGILSDVTALMRDAAFENGGHDLYIVGDQVWSDSPNDGPSYEPFDFLDGVTNYDVYGNMKRPNGYAGIKRLDDLAIRNTKWRDATRGHGQCAFVPGVAPGYNDRAVRDGNTALSRKLYEGAPEGSLFKASLQKALPLVEDSTGRMLMINSWNEWHEDTQIEPVANVGPSHRPLNLTCYGDVCDRALEYEAYDTLYLDILRDITSSPSYR